MERPYPKPDKDGPYQLIVEGKEDLHFFGNFQEKMWNNGQIDEGAYIRVMDGKDQTEKLKGVLLSLMAFAQRSDPVRAIGLIGDADDDPGAMFSSLQGAVAAVGTLPVPSQIGVFQTGTRRQPRVGILVLPPDRPGIRETLCLEAVSSEPVMPCVEDFMDCVVANGNNPHDMRKARLLAYLAAQNDTDSRIGIAVQRGYIPWDSPVFEIVRQFLKDLTEPA
jgi:hypothetical protein